MLISVLDLFKIGIGPSSSHTVGPMKAAALFAGQALSLPTVEQIARVQVELYGSLAATGKGHGTDKAVLLGLEGELPDLVDIDRIPARLAAIRTEHCLHLGGTRALPFHDSTDLIFRKRQTLPIHPNGMRFTAFTEQGEPLLQKEYYSVGGGFIQTAQDDNHMMLSEEDTPPIPYPFTTADQLLTMCRETQLSISDIVLANESFIREEAEIRRYLADIWQVMQACVQRGCAQEGILPGGLKVKRRAAALYQQLTQEAPAPSLATSFMHTLSWINLYALAVNEENAAGGRIVTAPTNGAAGIIPAVLHFYHHFTEQPTEEGTLRFLLTAGAIGTLFKRNASISGAEVGCQGEVGSACSMAAAGLTEVLGGTPAQVENAAEIAIEHNLGLTCDPIGGLVQVPCIERNAMAAVKAINATRLALSGDGQHFVSLDKAIKTMRDTGNDMKNKYKETARGGLAINVIEIPVSVISC